MSETKTKRAGWPQIGTIRKSDKGSSYIKLQDNVTLLVDGKPVELNKSRTLNLQDPRKKVEMLRDKGHITEAEADKRLEKLSEATWLRYEIVAAPNKAE